MQPFEYRSVRLWSKESNRTRTGGRKRFFFNSRPRAPYGLRQPRRLNPVNPGPRGLPGVAEGRYYTRASAYTACAAASSIFCRFLSAARGALAALAQKKAIQKLACVHAPQTEAANERSWQRAAPYSTGPRQQSRVQSPTRSPRKLIWRQASILAPSDERARRRSARSPRRATATPPRGAPDAAGSL